MPCDLSCHNHYTPRRLGFLIRLLSSGIVCVTPVSHATTLCTPSGSTTTSVFESSNPLSHSGYTSEGFKTASSEQSHFTSTTSSKSFCMFVFPLAYSCLMADIIIIFISFFFYEGLFLPPATSSCVHHILYMMIAPVSTSFLHF